MFQILELGVDEITLVLQLSKDRKNILSTIAWPDVAEKMLDTFAAKAAFEMIYGEKKYASSLPKGYIIGYTYGEHNFYLAVAYHPQQKSMGVVAKFSALALDFYCEKTGLKVYQFLQMVCDDLYELRLSRIDLTADYIDEGLNVTDIYQGFMDGKIGVFREHINDMTGEITYKKCPMQLQGFLKESDVPTTYLGSVQSNSRLRIYDKKREQMERKGSKYDKALKCKDWVRFEGVFRHEFAHQISDEMLSVSTDDEFANLIACVLVQKFRLMYVNGGVVDCDTEYSQMIIDCISNVNFTLKSPCSRNNDIMRSLHYLLYGSGIMNLLSKIQEIWGKDAIEKTFDFLKECLEKWKPNPECITWLIKNTKDYQYHYPDFDVFLFEAMSKGGDSVEI